MLLVDTNIWLVAADGRSGRHDEITMLLTGQDWASPTHGDRRDGVADPRPPRTGPHQRFLRLVTTYADLRLDLADAALVAIAERLGQTTIATLNHRDFRVVRPVHCDAFELVP